MQNRNAKSFYWVSGKRRMLIPFGVVPDGWEPNEWAANLLRIAAVAERHDYLYAHRLRRWAEKVTHD